jgi:hypothetical protein
MNLKDLFGGVGQTAKDLRQAIKNDLPAEKRAELEMKLMELEQQSMEAQKEINKIEASSRDKYRSYWRPTIGWICTSALMLHYLIFPSLIVICPSIILPDFDMATLMPLVFALLGIGGYRTWEKTKGIE